MRKNPYRPTDEGAAEDLDAGIADQLADLPDLELRVVEEVTGRLHPPVLDVGVGAPPQDHPHTVDHVLAAAADVAELVDVQRDDVGTAESAVRDVVVGRLDKDMFSSGTKTILPMHPRLKIIHAGYVMA